MISLIQNCSFFSFNKVYQRKSTSWWYGIPPRVSVFQYASVLEARTTTRE